MPPCRIVVVAVLRAAVVEAMTALLTEPTLDEAGGSRKRMVKGYTRLNGGGSGTGRCEEIREVLLEGLFPLPRIVRL